MVDIDRELVELCQKLLPEWHGRAFEDSRAEVLFADGKEYVEQTSARFDVIVIDVCDALEPGPALSLYTEAFYRQVRERLKPGGLLVVQAMELSGLDYRDHVRVRDALIQIFPLVRSYSTFIPSFWGEWGFLTASDDLDPAAIPRDVLVERLRTRGPAGAESVGDELDFYDPDTHVRLFALSKDVRNALNHVLPDTNTPE
jgi:spermidine synthase